MASVYPGAVDAFSDPLSNSPLSSPSHSQLHSDVNDALEKIETYVPRRNLVYNGAMQIHQRGTSTTGINSWATIYYTADRWLFNGASIGTYTQDIQNDAPTGSGFRKSFRVLTTTGSATSAGSYLLVSQRLEGQDLQSIKKGTSSAEQLTISFWVKSNVTGTYICELFDVDNNRHVARTYTVSSSGTWELKVLTFPADTTGAFDNDNNNSLEVVFWLAAGSTYSGGSLPSTWQSVTTANRAAGQTNVGASTNNYWQVTGVQMNVGAVAAPFEFKNYGRDLRECQRYYQRFSQTSATTYGHIATGLVTSATGAAMTLPLFTPLRGVPLLSFSAADTFFVDVVTGGAVASTIAASAGRSTPYALSIAVTKGGVGMTSGQYAVLLQDSTDACFIAADAEL